MTELNDIRLQRLMENQFVLRVACHDIANPLAIIMTALSICQSSDDIDEIHKFLEKIRRAANEQRTILRELRDAKDILASDADYRLEDVDVKDVIECALNAFAEELEAKSLTVNFSCGVKEPRVKADSFLFDKLFIRPALANAIKFSEPGGKIDVTVSQQANRLCITVRDEGIGIEEDWLSKVFSPDFRDTRPQAAEGSGIGYALPLMKMYLHRIDGSLELASKAKSAFPSGSFTELKASIPLA